MIDTAIDTNTSNENPKAFDDRREFRNASKQDLHEFLVRARLQRLTHFVEGLTTVTLNLLLAEKPLARELLQELVVKEAALEWIARVATVSNAVVRDRMLEDINKALDELELLIDLVTRSYVNWPVNAAMEFRDELAYIT